MGKIIFEFKNSLQANKCQVIPFKGKIIVEFRKVSDNLLEGTMDKLISEKVINKSDLQDHFESVTGIYLSYLD